MLKAKAQTVLDPRTVKSFAGVRGRVQAAVAMLPRSVSLSEALLQTQKFQKLGVTKK